MAKLNPYIFFNGNCEEAFTFYKSVFGNDLSMAKYKDAPQTDRQIFHEEDNKVMHVSLPISRETTLMGADFKGLNNQSAPANNFALYVNTDTKEEADRMFRKLSEDGQINMPMTEVFWGSYYGFLTDKFGIGWKISFDVNAYKVG